jgi:tetratricopeptide (TPR) repeat protein
MPEFQPWRVERLIGPARSAWRGRSALFVAGFLAACQPTPEELWERAEAAGAAGDLPAAVIRLKSLLQQQPDNGAARIALGRVKLALGDPESAEKEIRRAIAIDGNSADLKLSLVEALLAQRRFQDALNEVGAAADAETPAMRSLMLAGRAYEGMGRRTEAEARYRQAMAASPAALAPLVATAALLINTGRGAEADPLIEQAILLDRRSIRALVLKGRRIAETRGAREAAEFFRQTLDVNTGAPGEAEILVNLSELQLVLGDLNAASGSVRRLEAIAPVDIHARFLRARVQAQSGDYTAAILSLQKIMNDAPDFLPAERLLGSVYYLNGNPEQAAMHFSRLAGRGEKDNAGVAGRLFKAAAHLSRGEEQEAIAEYEAALRQDARQPAALNNLAWLYLKRDDPRALMLAEQALVAQPESAPIKDTLGWIEVHRGDKRRGLALIAAAASASPGDADIQYHLAFALAENGEVARARGTLAALLAAAPKFPSRSEAESLMHRLDERSAGAGG